MLTLTEGFLKELLRIPYLMKDLLSAKALLFHWPENRVGSRQENTSLIITLKNIQLLGRIYPSFECLCILFYLELRKKHAELQENIPIGIIKICICFLEVELLCEILGPKYKKNNWETERTEFNPHFPYGQWKILQSSLPEENKILIIHCKVKGKYFVR